MTTTGSKTTGQTRSSAANHSLSAVSLRINSLTALSSCFSCALPFPVISTGSNVIKTLSLIALLASYIYGLGMTKTISPFSSFNWIPASSLFGTRSPRFNRNATSFGASMDFNTTFSLMRSPSTMYSSRTSFKISS